jgi:hypothetical protein
MTPSQPPDPKRMVVGRSGAIPVSGKLLFLPKKDAPRVSIVLPSACMPASPSRVNGIVTAASMGIVAMVLADMVHEALGHGTACLLTGNRILTLSTVAIQTAARAVLSRLPARVPTCSSAQLRF